MKNKKIAGVRLEQHKLPALTRSIKRITPRKVYIPLPPDSTVCVDLYTKVSCGQAVTKDVDRFGHAYVISPVDGLYKGVVELPDGLGNTIACAFVQTSDEALEDDGSGRQADDISQLPPEEILARCKDAWVIDELDGEYLHEKLVRFGSAGLDALVVRAVDDEPYLSSSMSLLYKLSEPLCKGLALACRVAGVKQSYALVYAGAYDEDIPPLKEVNGVPVKRMTGPYPQQNQITQRMERYGKCGFISAQALIHLYRAAAFRQPHTTCFVTVAGECVATPRNVEVPVGMLVEDLLDLCGLHKEPGRVVVGGSMRGITIDSLQVPLNYQSRAVLALKADKMYRYDCMGCSKCQRVCPAGLMPSLLYKAERYHVYRNMELLNPSACIECGACAYVCPSRIDLLYYIRSMKNRDTKEKISFPQKSAEKREEADSTHEITDA